MLYSVTCKDESDVQLIMRMKVREKKRLWKTKLYLITFTIPYPPKKKFFYYFDFVRKKGQETMKQ